MPGLCILCSCHDGGGQWIVTFSTAPVYTVPVRILRAVLSEFVSVVLDQFVGYAPSCILHINTSHSCQLLDRIDK